MTLIRWVSNIDLEELVVPLQHWYDSIAREDVIDRKASKVQFSSGVRGSHGSGKGYDLASHTAQGARVLGCQHEAQCAQALVHP